MKFSTRD